MAGDGVSAQTKRALASDPDLDQGLSDAPVGAAADKVQAASSDKNRKVYTPKTMSVEDAAAKQKALNDAANAKYEAYQAARHKR